MSSEAYEPGRIQGLTREMIDALMAMFEKASAGAIAVDRESRITWINDSYCQLLGKRQSDVIGQPVRRIIPTVVCRKWWKAATPVAGHHGA